MPASRSSDYHVLTWRAADGASRGGVLIGDLVFDLESLTGGAFELSTVQEALEHWPSVRPVLEQATGEILAAPGGPHPVRGMPLRSVQLLAPLPRPGTIFCAGANYTDHIAEMRAVLNLPDEGDPKAPGRAPWHFLKSASCVVGPGAEIPLPAYSRRVDWEAEIAVVIGMPARDVPVERAMEHVAGFTIINDLSARDFLKRANVPAGSPFAYDWLSQKCFDGACPMGPWLTPRERIPDPDDMKIELWVNDCLKQDSTSRNLIFTAAEQVAYLSTRLTLRPGDVIATGTPAGVGMARGEFLKPGDEVRIRIGGIGELRHRMV